MISKHNRVNIIKWIGNIINSEKRAQNIDFLKNYGNFVIIKSRKESMISVFGFSIL